MPGPELPLMDPSPSTAPPAAFSPAKRAFRRSVSVVKVSNRLLDTHGKIQFLAQVPMFGRLEQFPHCLAALAASLVTRTYAAGVSIVTKSEIDTCMYLIVTGSVEVLVAPWTRMSFCLNLLQPPLPSSLGVSMVMERGRQQNDSLVNGQGPGHAGGRRGPDRDHGPGQLLRRVLAADDAAPVGPRRGQRADVGAGAVQDLADGHLQAVPGGGNVLP